MSSCKICDISNKNSDQVFNLVGFNATDKDIWLAVFKSSTEHLSNVSRTDFFSGYILIHDRLSCVRNCDGHLGYWGLNLWVIAIL